MLNDEVTSALARFFEDGRGPSHDELDRIFERCGVRDGDPRREAATIGKMKRVRAILGHTIDQRPEKGAAVVQTLLGAIRAAGGFRPESDSYAGDDAINALRHALRNLGFDLDAAGVPRPVLLENLEGAEMTEALWAYVRRARTGATDNELVIGTSKNLEEAAARHALKERVGQYPVHGNFQTTLAQAFIELGLAPSKLNLDKDPYRALQEAIFLLGFAVNRLRNDRGDGHGRPESSMATALEGRLSSIAAGLVTELLLTALSPN